VNNKETVEERQSTSSGPERDPQVSVPGVLCLIWISPDTTLHFMCVPSGENSTEVADIRKKCLVESKANLYIPI
jgi:hypothetical protein